MLILQRKEGQSITIGDHIVVTVQEIGQGRVRLSVDAPRDIAVLRTELVEAQRENQMCIRDSLWSCPAVCHKKYGHSSQRKFPRSGNRF